jgi:hypothetical protein
MELRVLNVQSLQSKQSQMIDATIRALAGSSSAFMRTDYALGNLLDG